MTILTELISTALYKITKIGFLKCQPHTLCFPVQVTANQLSAI